MVKKISFGKTQGKRKIKLVFRLFVFGFALVLLFFIFSVGVFIYYAKDLPRPEKFTETLAEKKDEIGMATGLAYTQAGGDILFIEVALMPGKGKLILTGQLGDVMKESGRAALSYIRNRWKELGLPKDFGSKTDIHIHVPEGAVPKDGPSAGVTITTALVSAMTQKPTRRHVGMTGEITLRGKVTEIGGLKEKSIAGHRAGLKTIVVPKENEKDMDDIPEKVKRDIKFIFAEKLEDVLSTSLTKWPIV